MSAILHAIVAGIEYDRIRVCIQEWRQQIFFSQIASGDCKMKYIMDGLRQLGLKESDGCRGVNIYGNEILDYIRVANHENIEDYFTGCCDECNIGLRQLPSRRYYRSITEMGSNKKEWYWYHMCYNCSRSKEIKICGCGDKMEVDEVVCLRCEPMESDDESDDDDY